MSIDTELETVDLQKKVPHLVSISEEGWSLRWENNTEPAFEIICSGATLSQVEKLEKALSKAYQKACEQQ